MVVVVAAFVEVVGAGVGKVVVVDVVVVFVVFVVLVLPVAREGLLTLVDELLLLLEVEELLLPPQKRKYAATPPPISRTATMARIKGSLLLRGAGAPY